MPFDTMAMAAVTDEIQKITNGRIQRIIQPSALSVALAVYAEGQQRWLLCSADPRYARVHFSSDRLAKAFSTPSSFIMLLRKYLEGAKVIEVEQVPGERVLILTCTSADTETRLITEVMGKHSNIILVDAAHTVLGAVKIVPPHQSRVRSILPGRPYSPPPPQERDSSIFGPGPRLDPDRNAQEFIDLLSGAAISTPLRVALRGLLQGASPFSLDQILLRGDWPAAVLLGDVAPAEVQTAAASLYTLYRARAWQSTTFQNGRNLLDFAPYRPSGMTAVEAAPSISAAIEMCLGTNESRDSLGSLRAALLVDVNRALQTAQRKVESLRAGLEAATACPEVMERGQLLLAYQYLVTEGSSELFIPDLDLTIPLDPALSPADNAARMFGRYHKLRDAGRRIPLLLTEAETEVERLQDLVIFVELAQSEKELRDLRRDLSPIPPVAPAKKQKSAKPGGPAHFRMNGYRAIVGRNARENEEVTFRLARRDDLWLHARRRTGAHVILTSGQDEAPDHIIRAAAALAAYCSEGRKDSAVDVDVTHVRNVRKIPGGAPGRVTYQHFHTLRVEPECKTWEPDRP